MENEEKAPITRRNSKKLQLEGCTPGLRVNDAASVFEKKAAQPPTPSIFRRNSVNSGQPNNSSSSSKWGGHSPSKSGDSQKGDMPFGGNSTGEPKPVAQLPHTAKDAKSQLLGNSLGVPEAPKPSMTKPVVAEPAKSLSPVTATSEKLKSSSSPKSKVKSKEASSSKAKNAVAKAILAAEIVPHQPSSPSMPVISPVIPTAPAMPKTPATPVTPKTPVSTTTSLLMNQSSSEAPKTQSSAISQITSPEPKPTTKPDPTEALTPPTTESSKDQEAKLAAVGVISREIFKDRGTHINRLFE